MHVHERLGIVMLQNKYERLEKRDKFDKHRMGFFLGEMCKETDLIVIYCNLLEVELQVKWKGV